MRLATCVSVVVIASASVLSAQNKPSTVAADSPACALLTKEAAAAALGEAVTGPKGTSMKEGPSSCEYEGSGIHRVHLNLMPMNAQTAGMYKMMCAQKNKDGLTGLGDTTCWYSDKHEELQVLKGMTFFSIELRRNGNPTEPIKTVAKSVYDRLK